MTSDRVDDGRAAGGRLGAATRRAGRGWRRLDRGWRASLLGLLAVCLVVVF